MTISRHLALCVSAAIYTSFLATQAMADGGLGRFVRTWTSPDILCTNQLFPLEGDVAIVDSVAGTGDLNFYTDSVVGGQQIGREGLGCGFYNLTPVHSGSYTGVYECGGEGFSEEYFGFPAAGDLLISVDRYETEFEIRREGHVERWTICQG